MGKSSTMKKNLAEMRCLDIYLSSLSEEKSKEITSVIEPSNNTTIPLLSWDFFSENHFKKIEDLRKKKDLNQLKDLAKKYNWKNNLEEIFHQNSFDAIILTDLNQKIIWVNDGFVSMTGYSKSFATKRTPRFLQGEHTSKAKKEKIKSALKKDKPFKEVVINYKKDKSVYKCQVKIIPLYDYDTTHFIALETEVV